MLNAPEPLRVAVLTSHRAPGLSALVHHSLHGVLFQIVGVVSSEEECADAHVPLEIGIPFARRPVRAFHHALGRPLSDMAARSAFDSELVPRLRSWNTDVVLCCSYLYLLTAPVLDEWRGAVFSVHHSDMLERTEDGRVRYRGLHAVRDAIMDGATETRSSVHQEWMLQRSWAPLMTHALELAALDRSGLATGEWLGAPWEVTVDGRLRATHEAVPR